MSDALLFRIVVGAVFGGLMGWTILDRERKEKGDSEGLRYPPYISGVLLPAYLLMLLILGIALHGMGKAVEMSLSVGFDIFWHIAVYDLLLLPLLPLLRRHFSARACAVLWILPNYLYLRFVGGAKMPQPALVLRTSAALLRWLGLLWAAGFVGVMLWKFAAHLGFRRCILKDAVPVNDPAVLAVWDVELANANFKKPRFKLLVSPAVDTPLSIGMWNSSTRVVLPEKSYTVEELHLLLRHELVHISRGDAANKFFLMFCTAMCWFDPLMWIAMGKSAEDLELSCDETVLLEADENARRRYADLLLHTAGDGRGFTTCLSASASSLRYRLKNVMAPPKKRRGALLVALAFLLLFLSCGYVALAYDVGRGDALLFYGVPEDCPLSIASLGESGSGPYRGCTVKDEAALRDYLASLELCRLTGGSSRDEASRVCLLAYEMPAGRESIVLTDKWVELTPLYGPPRRLEPAIYYVPDGIDWDYLDTLLIYQE